MFAYRRMQIDSYLSPCTKLKSKWIKDLSIKSDTLNLIEEKMRNSLKHIVTEDKFLNKTPMSQAQISMINTRDLMQLKASVRQRTPSIGQRDSLQNGKRFLSTPHPLEV